MASAISPNVTCASGINILYGNNAQGKTNWLEAVYMLAHAKSFRMHHLKETVKFCEREAVLSGIVTTGNEFERELQVNLNGTTKQTLNCDCCRTP